MKHNSNSYINYLKRHKLHAWRAATALATVLALTGNATAQEATVSQDAGGATELSAIVIDGATKIPTALIETPRTVSLISRDELDKRGVQDIIDPRATRALLCDWVEDAWRLLPDRTGRPAFGTRP